ncbi:CRTAC1 family protein, partial [Pirellulales bacterium]|nr:CRTAC1 family protein [Pirellulales bacterium]
PDIYVANDEEPNQLWVYQDDGHYLDEAVFRGVAFNADGKTEASMGVALGDVNNDCRMDLFMTHVTLETNTLYMSEGQPADSSFSDATNRSGMGALDLPYTGWGCGFLDLDHDGDLDLAVANGRVSKGVIDPNAKLGPFWNRYAERNFLFENDGRGKFSDVSDRAGKFAAHVEITRGLAIGDLDGDGDLDLVTNNLDNTLRLFRNNAPRPGTHWLMVRVLVGERDAIGAKVTLKVAGKERIAVVLPSYSFLASNDARVHFGLGSTDQIEGLEVTWPDGARERFSVPGVDQVLTVAKGSGLPVP